MKDSSAPLQVIANGQPVAAKLPCSIEEFLTAQGLLPRSVVAVVLALVGLNLADALLTLQHVGRGAIELNPLMELLLRQGPLPFLLGKHFIVAAAVMVMAAHSARRLAVDGLRFVPDLPSSVLFDLRGESFTTVDFLAFSAAELSASVPSPAGGAVCGNLSCELGESNAT